MASQKRRSLTRKNSETREIRKLYIIGVEGDTELAYFRNICASNQQVKYLVFPGDDSDPASIQQTVVSKLEELKNQSGLRSGDEAWIVLDREDGRNDEKIKAIFSWCAERADRFVALSDPKFEFWLLLHFESPSGIRTSKECDDRLALFIPKYRKGDGKQLPSDPAELAQAVRRGKQRLQFLPTSLEDFEGAGASTTVHFLVEHLLADQS